MLRQKEKLKQKQTTKIRQFKKIQIKKLTNICFGKGDSVHVLPTNVCQIIKDNKNIFEMEKNLTGQKNSTLRVGLSTENPINN